MYEELITRLNTSYQALNNTFHAKVIVDPIKEAIEAIETLLVYESLYKDLCDKGQKTAEKLLDAYPKWISAAERLPEKRRLVLCFLRSLDRKTQCYLVDYMLDDNQWWESGETWKYEVTHWMPLPEPPKEVDNG